MHDKSYIYDQHSDVFVLRSGLSEGCYQACSHD